jgi:hypothetical protein
MGAERFPQIPVLERPACVRLLELNASGCPFLLGSVCCHSMFDGDSCPILILKAGKETSPDTDWPTRQVRQG